MKLSPNPPRGMRDVLIDEASLRFDLCSRVQSIYRRHGFQNVETPAMAGLDVLTKKEGGENEKLIYKVLKRGEKLLKAVDQGNVEKLADLGLRYDLTVPLARYYVANSGKIPLVLKAMQTGPVWRAERPARGRFRQFTQFDIDIIGESSLLAELDLLLATSDVLKAIGLASNAVLHLNDRRLLASLAGNCGFDAEESKQVFISLDKWEKIGSEGVTQELVSHGFASEKIEKLMAVLLALPEDYTDYEAVVKTLSGHVDLELLGGVETLIKLLRTNLDGEMKVLFNPTLVRGMDYYSGPVFEITYGDYPFAIAGGGRYDGLIKRLFGMDAPSSGISFGLERIITILQDQKRTLDAGVEKVAFLVNASELTEDAVAHYNNLLGTGKSVSLINRKKKTGKQLNELQNSGFTHFILYNGEELGETLEIRSLD